MARRLKTYQTSSGFFELAVAAPSMKAAAEAWGSRTNVFKQGFAKETHDPDIVATTMAKPGAERSLQQAKLEYETKTRKIEKERAALDRRSQAENARWEKRKDKLETTRRRARD